MELNSICHLHCIVGVVIIFDPLLLWFGIYLYLVSAFRPRGVPGPTSKLSLCVPAQMGQRETEHKGEQ
jgi:hypothetical protein